MSIKKEYERPRMEVVKLLQQSQLMQASRRAGVQDYTVHDYEEE